MKFTIVTSVGPVAQDKKPVHHVEYPNTNDAKSAVESNGFVPDLKRGWSSEWNMTKRNSAWVYIVKNRNGKTVHAITLLRGAKPVDAPQKPAKNNGGDKGQTPTAKPSQARGKAAKKVAASSSAPAKPVKRIAKRSATNPDGSKHVPVMPGHVVEVTVHRGGTLVINYK